LQRLIGIAVNTWLVTFKEGAGNVSHQSTVRAIKDTT
jgi:hypothetical protein